jgi:hypothetical protein
MLFVTLPQAASSWPVAPRQRRAASGVDSITLSFPCDGSGTVGLNDFHLIKVLR